MSEATSNSAPRIVVVGSLNMDLVLRTPRFPNQGETVIGRDFHTFPGGKGANQAVTAARQGAEVIMVGRVGNDPFGHEMRESLEKEGIHTHHVRFHEPCHTGVALIAVDDTGENRIITISGANGEVSEEDIDSATAEIAASNALLVQLEVPLAAVIHAVQVAKQCGVKVILNPAPAQPLPSELLTTVDYLIPNEIEAALLSGCTDSAPEKAAQVLQDSGARNVVVTLGSQGALLADEKEIRSIPGFSVSVVDTTAAGDAFVGAFAVAIAGGKPTDEAARWANAAGALATRTMGAQPSLPDCQAVAQFLRSTENIH